MNIKEMFDLERSGYRRGLSDAKFVIENIGGDKAREAIRELEDLLNDFLADEKEDEKE